MMATESKDKLHVSWEDYNNDVILLKKEIEKIENPHLVTLYRGGLPLGTHLSNVMNLPLSIVDFQSYDGHSSEPELIKNAGICVTDTLVLVDDIFDKGLTIAKTVDKLYDIFPNIKIKVFTLYQNNHMSHLHKNYDFKVESLNNSHGLWVSFPWETL